MKLTLAMSVASAIAAIAVPVPAQEPAEPSAEHTLSGLAPGELGQAMRNSGLSLPTPGELFAAVEKGGAPEWAAAFAPVKSHLSADRRQIALRLGGLIAEGYLAVKAQDSRDLTNLSKEMIDAATVLGVGQDVLARGGSLNGFAADFSWTALSEELEAFQNEVALGLVAQKDDALVPLVAIGVWARAVRIAAESVLKDFRPDRAVVLRQPGVGAILCGRLAAVLPTPREMGGVEDTMRADLVRSLEALRAAVDLPPDRNPARAEAEAILAAADRMLALANAAAPVAAPAADAP